MRLYAQPLFGCLVLASALFSFNSMAQTTTGVNTPPGSGQLLNFGTQGNTYMIIDTSGNVGIGATPTAKLFLQGGANNSGTTFYINNRTRNDSQSAVYVAGGLASEDFVIQSNGTVGIGATAPLFKLEVTGVNVPSDPGSGASGIFAITTGTGLNTDAKLEMGVYESGAPGTSYSWLQAINSSSGFRNLVLNGTSGNVGIGITNPLYKLGVSNGGAEGMEFQPGNQPGQDFFQFINRTRVNPPTGTNYDDVFFIGDSFNFEIRGNQMLLIDSSGNLTSGGNVTATAYYHSSDARLKTDIKPIDHALDKMLALKGVTFNWKKNGRGDMGVTAQNVAEVFPNAVSKNADGMMAINSDSLVGPVIEAIRELKLKNDKLEAKNDRLEAEIVDIKKDMAIHKAAP